MKEELIELKAELTAVQDKCVAVFGEIAIGEFRRLQFSIDQKLLELEDLPEPVVDEVAHEAEILAAAKEHLAKAEAEKAEKEAEFKQMLIDKDEEAKLRIEAEQKADSLANLKEAISAEEVAKNLADKIKEVIAEAAPADGVIEDSPVDDAPVVPTKSTKPKN